MPYVSGQLTEGELEKLKKWLDEKWINRKCPACDHGDWEASTIVTQIPLFVYSDTFDSGRKLPIIHVTCQNCGYTMLFSAIRMGLVSETQAHIPVGGRGDAK